MSTNDTGAIIVLTTIADDESALRMSRTLVEEGLAACVTRTAVRSVYRWQDPAGAQGSAQAADATGDCPVCDEAEVMLVIKSARACRERLEARILELHPYECPEIVVFEPQHVEARYLAWILAC